MILTQQLILGVLVGGLYGLAAAGLSLTFGVLRVLNVAHGELLMLGVTEHSGSSRFGKSIRSFRYSASVRRCLYLG